MSKKLKEAFKADVPLVVHWDGKLIPDLTDKQVDRLPILVSGLGISQLLAVAKLASSWHWTSPSKRSHRCSRGLGNSQSNSSYVL